MALLDLDVLLSCNAHGDLRIGKSADRNIE
jgi:hypothetical protein